MKRDAEPERDNSVEAMMQRMADWADDMAGYFPDGPAREGAGYNHFKIPAIRPLIAPPEATPEIYRQCAQEVLRAASNISMARPEKFASMRVAAIIGYPDMFTSEVCVFFSEDYWKGFIKRTADDDRWMRLRAENSLAVRLGLKLPENFQELGYTTYYRDDSFDPPYEEEGEVWIYNDGEQT